MRISIQGLQEAQRDNLKMIQELMPASGLGEAVRVAVTDVHRYSVMITHVDTGSLRASHAIKFSEGFGGAQAELYISPTARNPRSGASPAQYGTTEHARAGTHAFYERTFEERGERALEIGAVALIRRLDA